MANNIGKNIRRLRTDCHMTQDTLAEKLFVSRQTVSNYETGKSNPDIDTLTKLAEIFETDVNTLIYGPPAPANKTAELRRLCVLLGTALALTLASFLLLPHAEHWRAITYSAGFSFLLRGLLLPAAWLLWGFGLLSALLLFCGAKRFSGKHVKAWHTFLTILTSLLFVLLVLNLLPLLDSSFRILLNRPFPLDENFFLSWISRLTWPVLSFAYKYNVLFLLPGALLALTRPSAAPKLPVSSESE